MKRYESIEPFERYCPDCRAPFMTTSSNPRTRCPKCRQIREREREAEREREREKKREWREPLGPPPANAWWLTEERSVDFARCDQELGASQRGYWMGRYMPRETFSVSASQTPLARIEAQDVEGRRTYRR